MMKRLTGPPEPEPVISSKPTIVKKNSGRTFTSTMKTETIKSLIETWFRATGFIASGEEVERFDFDNNQVFHTLKLKLKKRIIDES